jgi:hypothetical protein
MILTLIPEHFQLPFAFLIFAAVMALLFALIYTFATKDE